MVREKTNMKRIIITLIVILGIGLIGFVLYRLNFKGVQRMTGKVIIINGTSASGKSSIIKAFQEKCEDLWLAAGIDHLYVGVIPPKFLDDNPEHHNVMHVTNDFNNGKKVVTAVFGSDGWKIIKGMHRAIAVYARSGNNVLVDYIQYSPEWGDDLKKFLEGVDVTWVGINASLDLIEKREKERGTSPEGHARSHYDTVHKGLNYDLTLNVDMLNPEQAAEKIIEYVEQKKGTNRKL